MDHPMHCVKVPFDARESNRQPSGRSIRSYPIPREGIACAYMELADGPDTVASSAAESIALGGRAKSFRWCAFAE